MTSLTPSFSACAQTGVIPSLAQRSVSSSGAPHGTTLGSALGAAYAQCRGVAIGVQAAFGIGYSILEPVVKVINKFLSLLTPITRKPIPPIKADSGLRWPHTVYTNEEVIPDVQVCGHPPK